MKIPYSARLLGLGLLLFALAGCGGEGTTQAADASDDPAATAAPAEPAATAEPTGAVIEVKMLTDDLGNNRFEPEHVTAKKGDVIRFVLGTGVHNFHFIEGPAGATLPPVGQYLQLPGQTEDLVVDLPAGDYKYQCDPHAALGMVGELTVTG